MTKVHEYAELVRRLREGVSKVLVPMFVRPRLLWLKQLRETFCYTVHEFPPRLLLCSVYSEDPCRIVDELLSQSATLL